jgi:hypothetical protein
MSTSWGSGSNVPAVASGGKRWARIPGEFAQRIEVSDLRAILSKTLEVEEGTRGLLFQSGALVGDLGPGAHTLQTVADRLKALIFGSPVSVLVVDASQQRLTVELPSLLSQDNQQVNSEVTLVLELVNPLSFLTNLLKGGSRLTIGEVANWFRPAMTAVVGTLVRRTTVEELRHPEELADHLHDELDRRLGPQVAAAGFRLVRLDLVTFETPAHEELGRAWGRLSLEEARAELRERQRAIERRLEQESSDDRLAQIDSEAKFREFVERTEFEQKKGKLARERDWSKLYADFQQLTDDLGAQRSFLQRTRVLEDQRQIAELEYDFEVQAVRRRRDLDGTQLDHELVQARKRLEAKLAESAQLFEAEQQRLVQRAENDARIKGIELGSHQQEAQARLQRQRQRAEFAIDLQGRVQEQELTGKSAELDLELRRKTEEHRLELERVRLLNESRTETLIAVSGDKAAAHLAELQTLSLYQGLTPEQILAIKSAQSAESAQALAEKFRSEATATQDRQALMQQMYERMLAEGGAARQETEKRTGDTLAQFQNFTQMALTTQRDTSVAAATGRPAAMPPANTSNTPVTPMAGVAIACRFCGKPMQPQDAFCGSCGKSKYTS